MIKNFEQFELNEDWEEEDPNKVEKGPFDDQLKYGNDGPELKCFDRVIFIEGMLRDKIGTVVDYDNYQNYIVCLDVNVNGKCGLEYKYNTPIGHCWVSYIDELKLL